MGRKTLSKRNIRKLSRVGGGTSYSVTLPIDQIRELGWREKQKLVVERKGNSFVIRDWKK